jgi:hypothetical protein
MAISLRYLEILYGTAGAREKFEEMATHLIRSQHPSVERVRIHKGDGGIDAHDGRLSDPAGVDVFQVKYFPVQLGESQKSQIRESFKRARESQEFRAKSWTLCLPIDLSVDEKKWFDAWSAAEVASGIDIRPVWDATRFERLLMLEGNRGIRENYFREEALQYARESSGHLQKLLEEFIGRVPKPEQLDLRPALEAIGFSDVIAEGHSGAYVVLKARFEVKNMSEGKTARVWHIEYDFEAPDERIAGLFRKRRGAASHKVILPTGTSKHSIEFDFLITDKRPPVLFHLRDGLYATRMRYHAVSEDGVCESQSTLIGDVADANQLLTNVQNALRNKLDWR